MTQTAESLVGFSDPFANPQSLQDSAQDWAKTEGGILGNLGGPGEGGLGLEGVPGYVAPELVKAENAEEKPEEKGEDKPKDEEKDTEGDQSTDASEEKDAEVDADSSEEDAPELNTLSDIAEHLDIPLEELMSKVTHTVKAAGEEKVLSLADLEQGTQLKADFDKKHTQLAQERTRLHQETQDRIKVIDEQHEALTARFAIADKALEDDMSGPEMELLRRDHQGEWVARKMEIAEKRDAMRAQWQEVTTQRNAIHQKEQDEYFVKQGERLQADVEDWGQDKLNQALDVYKSQGFQGKDFDRLMDHRLIKGALEMHGLREKNKELEARLLKGEKAATRVKRDVPKMQKPGTRTAKGKPDSAALAKAKAAVDRDPSWQNQAALLALEGGELFG